MKRLLKILAITTALALLPILALAEDAFGAASVEPGAAYTLTEMLTYAMQDEYLAEAEYIAIQEAFGVDNPYTNIMGAEVTHQASLQPLFEAYSIPIPENTAANHVILPETLQETYAIGVQAEIANIAMYQAFLAQENLPQDVINTFTALMNASQSHLEAFSRNAEKDGVQLNTGTGAGYGQDNGNRNGETNSEMNQERNSEKNGTEETRQNQKKGN